MASKTKKTKGNWHPKKKEREDEVSTTRKHTPKPKPGQRNFAQHLREKIKRCAPHAGLGGIWQKRLKKATQKITNELRAMGKSERKRGKKQNRKNQENYFGRFVTKNTKNSSKAPANQSMGMT